MSTPAHRLEGSGPSRRRDRPPERPGQGGLLRIGAAAAAAGVTERALRYYEEKGLIDPAERTPGGTRCYSEDDLARVTYIKQLQNTLALDLEEIATILNVNDRTARLKATWQDSSTDDEQRQSILHEASGLLQEMRSLVQAKRAALDTFLADTEAKIARIDAEMRRR